MENHDLPLNEINTSNIQQLFVNNTYNEVFRSFYSGAVSATLATLLFQPLDVIKTRLQNPIHPVTLSDRPGISSILTHILKHEGISGLWKGLVPSLIRCVPGISLQFSAISWLQTEFVGTSKKPGPVEAVLIGVIARSASVIFMIPVTVVKTRFESGVFQYKGIVHALNTIYHTEGAKGLCSGLVPTLVRDVPFSGLYFMFYTQSKAALPQEMLESSEAPLVRFLCGVLAGIMASGVTHPADVLKTKMQLYPHHFSGIYSVVVSVHEKDGLGGFFRGIIPRMLRRTLFAALSWTVYEQVMLSMR